MPWTSENYHEFHRAQLIDTKNGKDGGIDYHFVQMTKSFVPKVPLLCASIVNNSFSFLCFLSILNDE